MNRYICSDFYDINLSEAFGKWRRNIVDLHTEIVEVIRSNPNYIVVYIGGNDSLLYPICNRFLDLNTFRIIYCINNYKVSGRLVGCYPQVAPLPRRYAYSNGIDHDQYKNYVRIIKEINKDRRFPYPTGINHI
jgi:hypothetical protein